MLDHQNPLSYFKYSQKFSNTQDSKSNARSIWQKLKYYEFKWIQYQVAKRFETSTSILLYLILKVFKNVPKKSIPHSALDLKYKINTNVSFSARKILTFYILNLYYCWEFRKLFRLFSKQSKIFTVMSNLEEK